MVTNPLIKYQDLHYWLAETCHKYLKDKFFSLTTLTQVMILAPPLLPAALPLICILTLKQLFGSASPC